MSINRKNVIYAYYDNYIAVKGNELDRQISMISC